MSRTNIISTGWASQIGWKFVDVGVVIGEKVAVVVVVGVVVVVCVVVVVGEVVWVVTPLQSFSWA